MTKHAAIPPSPSADEHLLSAPSDDDDAFALDDPIALFADWFALAKANEPRDPHAMALATVDETGMPDVRTVLLKDFDDAGFVFYTNTQSAKGLQLAHNPKAALCFYWRSIVRQVRLRGPVSPVGAEEADAYFASRARDSRIGAWASAQSRPLESREALKQQINSFEEQYPGEDVPRPSHWSGYRVAAEHIEFWRERPFRLHDRMAFTKQADGRWCIERLYP